MASMTYIARCRCGCGGIIIAIVDSPEHKKDVARELADGIRQGYSFDRVPTEDARKEQWGCKKLLEEEDELDLGFENKGK